MVHEHEGTFALEQRSGQFQSGDSLRRASRDPMDLGEILKRATVPDRDIRPFIQADGLDRQALSCRKICCECRRMDRSAWRELTGAQDP